MASSIICTTAQIVTMREAVLESDSSVAVYLVSLVSILSFCVRGMIMFCPPDVVIVPLMEAEESILT